jgi:hypothetical protein
MHVFHRKEILRLHTKAKGAFWIPGTADEERAKSLLLCFSALADGIQ